MSGRQFTEKEVAQILRHAAEMQGDSGRIPEDGVSLEELQRIGSEVGLGKEHIEAALAQLDEQEDGQTRWLGAPPSYEFERIVEGNLTDEAWQTVVAELNATFHQNLRGKKTGPVRSWFWKHDLGTINFTVTQSENSVRLKVVSYIDDGIGCGMWVAGAAIVITCGALVEGLKDFGAAFTYLPFVVWPIVAILGGLWFRKITSNWYRRDRKKLSKMMSKLEGMIASAKAPDPLKAPVPAETDLAERLNQGQG